MNRSLFLVVGLTCPGAALAQTVSPRIALPPGTYRLGLVTRAAPPTIDLGAADGAPSARRRP